MGIWSSWRPLALLRRCPRGTGGTEMAQAMLSTWRTFDAEYLENIGMGGTGTLVLWT
jgi:hypothetical protein